MDAVDPSGASRQVEEELAAGLVALRDAWVELALIFRDLQFEADAITRDAASTEAVQILERIRDRAIGPTSSGRKDSH
jgi:hypothetical protein